MIITEYGLGYQAAMNDVAAAIEEDDTLGLRWVLDNRQAKDELTDVLTGKLAELDLPAGNFHPRDKRRAEALTLLASYFKADEYGEPDDAEYAAGSVMSFVQKLFGITSAEIEREVKS